MFFSVSFSCYTRIQAYVLGLCFKFLLCFFFRSKRLIAGEFQTEMLYVISRLVQFTFFHRYHPAFELKGLWRLCNSIMSLYIITSLALCLYLLIGCKSQLKPCLINLFRVLNMFSRQGTHSDRHVYVLSVCDAAGVLVKARRPVVVGTDAGHSQRHIMKILCISWQPIRLAP